jgi:hypothetical protein
MGVVAVFYRRHTHFVYLFLPMAWLYGWLLRRETFGSFGVWDGLIKRLLRA